MAEEDPQGGGFGQIGLHAGIGLVGEHRSAFCVPFRIGMTGGKSEARESQDEQSPDVHSSPCVSARTTPWLPSSGRLRQPTTRPGLPATMAKAGTDLESTV